MPSSSSSKPTLQSKSKAATASSTASSTKYDRAAHKNLKTFTAAVAGNSRAGDEEEDDGEEYDSEEDDDDDDDEEEDDAPDELELAEARLEKEKVKGKGKANPPASKSKKAAPPPSTKSTTTKSTTKKTVFISKEFIDDSDTDEPLGERIEVDDAEGGNKAKGKAKGKGKAKVKAAEPATKAGKSSITKPSKVAPKAKKERAPPAPKEGDAARGSTSQESHITTLKALLKSAHLLRPFTISTGAERTLTVEKRTAILEDLLVGVGLMEKRGGKLPTVGRAKEVGERRALEEEMKAIAGAPILEASLRDGKRRRSRGDDEDDEDEDEEDDEEIERGLVQKKKAMFAFLGQSSDSD